MPSIKLKMAVAFQGDFSPFPVHSCLMKQTKLRIIRGAFIYAEKSGWAGIRTLGTFRHTRFPGVRIRPLCHPSHCESVFLDEY